MNGIRKKFRIKEYRTALKGWKSSEEGVFCFLTDLHGNRFGENNGDLIRTIHGIDPHLILCGGDMNIRSDPSTLETAETLLSSLAAFRPVVMAPGNHESGMKRIPEYKPLYKEYLKKLKRAGVILLINGRHGFEIGNQPVVVTGTELSRKYYKNPFPPMLTSGNLSRLAGDPEPGAFNILLSHNPRYADAYFGWGADLTLSGHTHGGVVRFGEHIGAISPQDLLFPRYCCGDFYRNGCALIVSAGLGEHTIPLRIHDPRELIVIRVRPERV